MERVKRGESGEDGAAPMSFALARRETRFVESIFRREGKGNVGLALLARSEDTFDPFGTDRSKSLPTRWGAVGPRRVGFRDCLAGGSSGSSSLLELMMIADWSALESPICVRRDDETTGGEDLTGLDVDRALEKSSFCCLKGVTSAFRGGLDRCDLAERRLPRKNGSSASLSSDFARERDAAGF